MAGFQFTHEDIDWMYDEAMEWEPKPPQVDRTAVLKQLLTKAGKPRGNGSEPQQEAA